MSITGNSYNNSHGNIFMTYILAIVLRIIIFVLLCVALFYFAASTVKPKSKDKEKKEKKKLYLMYINILLKNGKTIKSENLLKEEPTTAKERERKHDNLSKSLLDQYQSGLIKIKQGLIPVSTIETISIELILIGSIVGSKDNTNFINENGLSNDH